MLDSHLINTIANLASIEKLIESKASEYLDSSKIEQMLSVDYRDINNLMDQQSKQAANSLFYANLTARLNCLYHNFQEAVFEPFLAHCRRFASLYLTSQKRKETIDGLLDAVMLVYSRNNTEQDRLRFATLCFDQMYKDALFSDETRIAKLKEFYREMYPISGDEYLTYEYMVEMRNQYKYRKEVAEGFCESFKQLMMAMSNISKLKLSGTGEGAVITENTLNSIRKGFN